MYRLAAALMLQLPETEIVDTGIAAWFLVPKVDHQVIRDRLSSGAANDDLEVISRKGKDHPAGAVNKPVQRPPGMIVIAEHQSLNCHHRRISSTRSVRMICRTPQKFPLLRVNLRWHVQEIAGDVLVDREKAGRIQLRRVRWMFSPSSRRARKKRLKAPIHLPSPENAIVVAGVAEAVRLVRVISSLEHSGIRIRAVTGDAAVAVADNRTVG